MKVLLLFSILVAAGFGCYAAPQPVHTPPPLQMPAPQVAYQQLLEVRYFAFGGVGIAGVTSKGEIAFRAIAGSTNGLELFSTALANGNPQTKLYALCGLRQLAPEKFEAAAKSIARTNSQVVTMSGCLVGAEPASNVVNRISRGYYDKYLTLPKP